ncbi:unnamed protein product [Protopolystoma xenopodis]|uniref:Uncharacterized protein n=1 Tax=Protopolystoma xenopodis TaxID=117903 RepID=A0A448XP37_9PLAT|nr:unnamed protein product [Protopolystoma xenopodis]
MYNNKNVPVKPIDSWSRGIRRRLLVEPTKSSSKANRQLVKRNSPSSSGGTDLRISSPNTSTRNGIKPIDSWSRGIRRRLLVEPTFESSRQHESSSKTNRQLVKRNPPSSSGGTDLRISSPNTSTLNGSNPNNYETRDSSKPNFSSYKVIRTAKRNVCFWPSRFDDPYLAHSSFKLKPSLRLRKVGHTTGFVDESIFCFWSQSEREKVS